MAVSLPDDSLREILVRLNDAATLLRCAAACRRWRHLIADPTFLRRRWPDHSCASFVGFFNKQRHRYQGAKVLVPSPWSPLGRGRRAISSFVHDVPASLLNHAAPLVSHRSLLLAHLLPPRGADDRWVVRLAVCNLLVGTCELLPPIMDSSVDLCEHKHHGCAVLSGDDCRSGDVEQPPPGNSSFYKVIIITTDREPQIGFKFDVHTFSSDNENWSKHTKCFSDTIDSDTLGSLCQSDAIVHHGAVHWLFNSWTARCFCLVKLDARSGDISFTRLHIPAMYHEDRACLGLNTTDGALSVLRMQEAASSKLEIWRQQKDQSANGTSQWICTDTVELIQPRRKVTQERDMLYILLGEKCGKLLVSDRRRRVYLADLVTGIVEAVADWDGLHPNIPLDVVPLEMDWPAFFLSRLCTASESSLPLPPPCKEVAPRRRRRRRGRERRKTRRRGEATDEGMETTSSTW